MPMKLSTTIGKIQKIPNTKNIEIMHEFLDYMRKNDSSEHHQNNNLKVVIAFANFLGKNISFDEIQKKEQVLGNEKPEGQLAEFLGKDIVDVFWERA